MVWLKKTAELHRRFLTRAVPRMRGMLDSILTNLVEHRAQTDVEDGRGFLAIPAGHLQRSQDHFFLRFLLHAAHHRLQVADVGARQAMASVSVTIAVGT